MSGSRREYYRRTRKVRKRQLSISKTGWTGLCFGLGSVLLFGIAVALSCMQEGDGLFYVGSMGLFALVLAAGGLVLGIMGCREEDVRPVPPRAATGVGAVMTALLVVLYII